MVIKRKVKTEHIPPDRVPIRLVVGDIVEVVDENNENPNWKNWLWCTKKSDCQSGWVPKQLLTIYGSTGTAIQTYSAVELHVIADEVLEVEYRLNGWAWCKKASGAQGWVPEENFEP